MNVLLKVEWSIGILGDMHLIRGYDEEVLRLPLQASGDVGRETSASPLGLKTSNSNSGRRTRQPYMAAEGEQRVLRSITLVAVVVALAHQHQLRSRLLLLPAAAAAAAAAVTGRWLLRCYSCCGPRWSGGSTSRQQEHGVATTIVMTALQQ